jgi:hypothetical protein
MDLSARPFTCPNAVTLDPAGHHAVYGMQEHWTPKQALLP